MIRAACLGMGAALAIVALGCRMCADHYDYTGPVVGGPGCAGPPVHSTARAGSILSAARHPVHSEPVPGPAIATEYPPRSPSHPSAGSAIDYRFARDPEIARGQIISITDRRLDELLEREEESVARSAAEPLDGAPAEGGWRARPASRATPADQSP